MNSELCEHCHTSPATIGMSCQWCCVNRSELAVEWWQAMFRRDQVKPVADLTRKSA